MPFSNPTFGTGLDIADGRYLIKVKSLEDAPAGEYGPGIKWIFQIASADGTQIMDDLGFPAELWQFSSQALSLKSKGGEWATALLGRELTDEDTGAAIGAALLGKKAIALIAKVTSKTGKERSAIIKMTPFVTADTKAKAGPAKSQPPEEPPDEVLLKDEEAALPF